MKTAYYEIKVNKLSIIFSLKFKAFSLLNSFKSIKKVFFYIIVSFLMLRVSNCIITQLLIA